MTSAFHLPLVMVRTGAKVFSSLLQLCASPPQSKVGEAIADPAHTPLRWSTLTRDGPNNVAQRYGPYAQRNYSQHIS